MGRECQRRVLLRFNFIECNLFWLRRAPGRPANGVYEDATVWPSSICPGFGTTTQDWPRDLRLWNSENSKANRIETMTSPSTASLSRVARCWHSNTYFSLFSSLFFFDPPNRFVQIPRGRRINRVVATSTIPRISASTLSPHCTRRDSAGSDASQRCQLRELMDWEGPNAAGSRPAGAVASARDELQPRRRMEGAHQQVHRDHSAQRRRMRRSRAEDIRLTAEHAGE